MERWAATMGTLFFVVVAPLTIIAAVDFIARARRWEHDRRRLAMAAAIQDASRIDA